MNNHPCGKVSKDLVRREVIAPDNNLVLRETNGQLIVGMAVALFAISAICLSMTQVQATQDEGIRPSIWPCDETKIVELRPESMWDGPSIEGINNSHNDETLRKLILILAHRRIELTAAKKAIADYAESQPQDKQDRALTILFAGVFDNANRRRRNVIHGIERYQMRLHQRAEALKKMRTEVAELRREAGTSMIANEKAEAAQTRYDWNARIFEERQKNISLACEIPALIEQRVSDLAQEIRALMNK